MKLEVPSNLVFCDSMTRNVGLPTERNVLLVYLQKLKPSPLVSVSFPPHMQMVSVLRVVLSGMKLVKVGESSGYV